MNPLLDNYLALYLSITKNYSPDKSLRAMGIAKDFSKLNIEDRKIKEEINEAGNYKLVEGSY